MTGRVNEVERVEPHPLVRFLMHFMTDAQLAECKRNMARVNAAAMEGLAAPRAARQRKGAGE